MAPAHRDGRLLRRAAVDPGAAEGGSGHESALHAQLKRPGCSRGRPRRPPFLPDRAASSPRATCRCSCCTRDRCRTVDALRIHAPIHGARRCRPEFEHLRWGGQLTRSSLLDRAGGGQPPHVLDGGGASPGPLLSVRDGDCGGAELTCSESSGDEPIALGLVQGQQITLVVDGAAAASEDFELRLPRLLYDAPATAPVRPTTAAASATASASSSAIAASTRARRAAAATRQRLHAR